MGKLEVFNKLLVKKSSLLRCIFTTLIFQILVTSVVFSHIYYNSDKYAPYIKAHPIISIVVMLGICVGLIFAMTGANMSFAQRVILFMLLSVIQGFILGAAMEYVSKDIIMSALVSTIAIFVIFLTIGFFIVYWGIDLGWIEIYLLYALICLIIINIVSVFVKPTEGKSKISVIIGLILFSIFILYDTNRILIKYSNVEVDCIRGALDYYFDIINLFLYSTDSK